MTDTEIWNFAPENNYVILTKDVDFYNRFLVSEETPKVIFFQIGNYSLKQLYDYFDANCHKLKTEII